MGAIKKRSISINGHRTSYSIEDEFQALLEAHAKEQNKSLAGIIADIDCLPRHESGLSSAIRVFVLNLSLKASPTVAPEPLTV